MSSDDRKRRDRFCARRQVTPRGYLPNPESIPLQLFCTHNFQPIAGGASAIESDKLMIPWILANAPAISCLFRQISTYYDKSLTVVLEQISSLLADGSVHWAI